MQGGTYGEERAWCVCCGWDWMKGAPLEKRKAQVPVRELGSRQVADRMLIWHEQVCDSCWKTVST